MIFVSKFVNTDKIFGYMWDMYEELIGELYDEKF